MEDGIETYKTKIFDYIETANNDYTQKKINQKIIYIYNKGYGTGKYNILENEERAIQFSKENKCRVEIFQEEANGIYAPINEYYQDGIKYQNS
jgi:hypothetical protein